MQKETQFSYKTDQEIIQMQAKNQTSSKSIKDSFQELKEIKTFNQARNQMIEKQEQDQQPVVKPLPLIQLKSRKTQQSEQKESLKSKMKKQLSQRKQKDIRECKEINELKKNTSSQIKKVFIILGISILALFVILCFNSLRVFSLSGQINVLKSQLKEIKMMVNKYNSEEEIKILRNQIQIHMKITNSMLYNTDQSLTLGKNETVTDKKDAMTNKNNIQYLSSLKNAQLKYLYLWNNQFADSDIESIFKAPWFNQIKALELNKNELTDSTIDLLINKKRPNLIWLNLSKNKISDQGIIKLINNSHMFPNLKYINYVSQSIEDIYKVHLKMKEMLPNVNFVKQE